MRLLNEINVQLRKAPFRDMANDLFNRPESPKKRVIAKRQLALLNILLEMGEMNVMTLHKKAFALYQQLGDPWRAFVRDVNNLLTLDALHWTNFEELIIDIDLHWPQSISEGVFFQHLQALPKAKTYKFFQRSFPT